MNDAGNELPVATGFDRVGTLLADKYRIVRPLGEGGMGAVFEAEHTFLKRRFAIKFLRSELLKNAELVARFRREAQASGQLEHENIASVTDFGVTASGTPYFVMEYLKGQNLSHVIKTEGPLTAPRAVAFALQACRGLGAAHARGIVHRDLKPDNLFVCPREDGSEWIKVLDFGIAKIRLGAEEGLNTRTGTTMGTPYYMSPEQARGDKNVDHRTDIYSLGAVLYEALSGEKPHEGTTYNEIIYYILTREPVPLRQLRPELPRGVVAVVERAMAREVGDRFENMAAFATALAAQLGNKPGVQSPQPAQVPADGTAPTLLSPASLHAVSVSAPAPGPATPTPAAPAKPSRARAALAVGAVLAVLAFIAVGLIRRSNWGASTSASSSEPSAVSASSVRGEASSSAAQVSATGLAALPAKSDDDPASERAPKAPDEASSVGHPVAAAPPVAPRSQRTQVKGATSSPHSGSPKYDRKNPYQ